MYTKLGTISNYVCAYTGFSQGTTSGTCEAGAYAHFMEERTVAKSANLDMEFSAGFDAAGVNVGGTASGGWTISYVANSPTDYTINMNAILSSPSNINVDLSNPSLAGYWMQLNLPSPNAELYVQGVAHGIMRN